MRIPQSLVDAVKQRQAVLFAGSGISIQSHQVTASGLRDALGIEIQKDYPTYDFAARSLEDVCDEYAVLNDRLNLVNRLASEIPKNAMPLASHVAAVKAFRFIV